MFCVSTKFLRPTRVKMAAGCSFETLVTCCCFSLLFDGVLAAPNISRRARSDSNQLAVFTQCRPI